ncbi:MAG: hypothetical protein ABUK01_05015 [Leptospirales bacterium]
MLVEKIIPNSRSAGEAGKTALYYEYTSVDVREDHVIENTLTALQNDPDVIDENIKIVTYYLVQRFFIKSANLIKENIDLISQIPQAFRKMVDSVPAETKDKKVLVKYIELYLVHTISAQEDQVKLFEGYSTVLKKFMHKLITQKKADQKNIIHNKEVIIDQVYQYINSVQSSIQVTKEPSRAKATKKIDNWITKIYENHVIQEAFDVIVALEEYCHEEMELSKERVDFLRKYQKLNIGKISKSIVEDADIVTIQDGWPVISENIFIYIDNLTREHGDYRKFLKEVFTPLKEEFVDYFFSQFFLISAYQNQTEKDIYLLEKTLKDLHLMDKFKSFFTLQIHKEIEQGEDKGYYIENFFQKLKDDIKGPHQSTFSFLTLKYLLEDTLELIQEDKDKDEDPEKKTFFLYKKAFNEFVRAKYPKFLDNIIYLYLKHSKDLERKIGNTQKAYGDIYNKNTALLQEVFATLELEDIFNRNILPIITGLAQSDQILKTNK